jgi:hypothetical protein
MFGYITRPSETEYENPLDVAKKWHGIVTAGLASPWNKFHTHMPKVSLMCAKQFINQKLYIQRVLKIDLILC